VEYLRGVVDSNITEILNVLNLFESRIERNSEDVTELRITQGHTSDMVNIFLDGSFIKFFKWFSCLLTGT
jgi:hypothetical protein